VDIQSEFKKVEASLIDGAAFGTKEFMRASKVVERVDHETVSQRLQNTQNVRLLHVTFGLCTEAAEFQDAMKKHLFYGKDLDRANLIEEMGDMLWYMAIGCDEIKTTFEEVMQKNSKKLTLRYKGGFTETQALGRDLAAEREILEAPHPNLP